MVTVWACFHRNKMVATMGGGWVSCLRSSDLPGESYRSGVSQAGTSKSCGEGILPDIY